MAHDPRITVDVQSLLKADVLATNIVNLWVSWKASRSTWENDKKELREYLVATDTTKTSNKKLPWKNSTTTPKLTQIRDNLHANYMSALFPHDDWFVWEPATLEEATAEKTNYIKAYMKNKLTRSGFYETMSRLVYDYIDYGNAFAEVNYLTVDHERKDIGRFAVYHGPICYRISPLDIVFDITAMTFKHTPKITRSLISLGTLKQKAQTIPWAQKAFDIAVERRTVVQNLQADDVNKQAGVSIDGFSSFVDYLASSQIEILEFEGDLFDPIKQTLLTGHKIIVIDRKTIVYQEPFESWLGCSSKEHVAWRLRSDNLMGMGPLDNLVGMQYRIDHLENLKADVFDQIAHPVVIKRGYVEDFTWGPGEQINCDTDATVETLHPDTIALNADLQIQNTLNIMEEMAGAPKQAMGIRTPGEKTAFEVQSLDNAAGRIFQSKITWFETQFIEPILNQMLEQARRNLEITELVSILDEDYGVTEFMNITQKDLQSKGRLVPMGARHYARQNQLAQNIMGFVNSAAYQDPLVQAHISG